MLFIDFLCLPRGGEGMLRLSTRRGSGWITGDRKLKLEKTWNNVSQLENTNQLKQKKTKPLEFGALHTFPCIMPNFLFFTAILSITVCTLYIVTLMSSGKWLMAPDSDTSYPDWDSTHPPLVKLPAAPSNSGHWCNRHFLLLLPPEVCLLCLLPLLPSFFPQASLPLASLCRADQEERTQSQQIRLSMYTLFLTCC